MMQAFGIRYQSAGENIGWNTYGDAGTAASQINSAFMNSPDHRSNILNGNFTALGIGSDNSGSRRVVGRRRQLHRRLDVLRGVRPAGRVAATAPSASSTAAQAQARAASRRRATPRRRRRPRSPR